MPEDTPEPQPESHRAHAAEVVQEIVETIGELVKSELEFRRTGIFPQPGAPSLSGFASDALTGVVKQLSDLARDELEFRATGKRPVHNPFEELHAQSPNSPPRGALVRARTAEELGIDPESIRVYDTAKDPTP